MRADLEILQGACDIHVHTNPDVFPRMVDDVEAATLAKEYCFRAIITKSHQLETASRAHFARRAVEGIDIFGSTTLDYTHGGLNPFCVDAVIKVGGKKVFMPTTDAAYHKELFGSIGGVGSYETAGPIGALYARQPPLCIIDDEGKVLPAVLDILKLIADANIIVSAGHTSLKEIRALLRACKDMGIKKVVVDHPFFTRIPVAAQEEIVKAGAYINYAYWDICPKFFCVSLPELAAAIRRVGPDRAILTSDAGQLFNAPPAECLRTYVQMLLEEGFSFREIRQMLCDNPGFLIYG
ncbi:MAG: DUF6282 family protein [Nitrospinota bacterium]